MNEEAIYLPVEEATERVNSLQFPAAVVGETVKQFGHWFELTESGWVPIPSPV